MLAFAKGDEVVLLTEKDGEPSAKVVTVTSVAKAARGKKSSVRVSDCVHTFHAANGEQVGPTPVNVRVRIIPMES